MQILFVAPGSSIHTARWISQLNGTGWDLHLFDSADLNLNPALSGVTVYRGWYKPAPEGATVRYCWPFPRGNTFIRRRFPRIAQMIVPEKEIRLAQLMRRLRPDCIHSLNMQYSAYPLFQARQRLGGSLPAPWIYSSWGSDLYLFGQDPEHEPRIREVMSTCDYYISDCERDIKLAREFGFKGEALGVFPGGGGYDIDLMRTFRQSGPISDRRTIAVKGYQKWAGKALVALEAIELCADALSAYEVVVYSTNESTEQEVQRMASSSHIPIEVMPRRPHEEMWRLFGRSRIAIGISSSDGTPNTMLEAMIMGALPIQTDAGGAITEWIQNGVNGLIVPLDDPQRIAQAVRKAIADDELVNRAATINHKMTSARVSSAVIRPRVIELYNQVVNEARN